MQIKVPSLLLRYVQIVTPLLLLLTLFFLWWMRHLAYEAVLPSRALGWAIPPILLLSSLYLIGAILLYRHQQQRQSALQQLIQLTREVTQLGKLDTSLQLNEDSDLGQLSGLFDELRRALKKQIDHSRLLLDVGQKVSGTVTLAEGMEPLLQAFVQALGVDSARAVVVNPQGGRPLQFGVGDLAEPLMQLDRRILTAMRTVADSFILRSPSQIRERLTLSPNRDLLIHTLFAFPLVTQDRLQGVLWLGCQNPRTQVLDLDIVNPLLDRTNALLSAAHFYALAEGGRRRLSAVLSSSHDGVIVIDHTQRILLINPALEEGFVLDGREMMGRLVADVIPQGVLRDCLMGAVSDVHGREIVSPKGKRYYASVAKVVGTSAELMGRVVVLHDITQWKELDALKSQFVAMVAHDLRNPLVYMHTYASLLMEPEQLSADDLRGYAAQIVNGIERMNKNIGQLLELNRLEAGQDQLQSELIELEPFLTQLQAEHQPRAKGQGNEIKVSPLEAGLAVSADRWALQVALNNLITNALNYARGQGEILLTAVRSEQNILLSVRDHGMGIAKEDQLRIFERFYRASRPESLHVAGSGLGLAITKTIAQQHGGRVWCESSLGKGATFYLALPMTVEKGA